MSAGLTLNGKYLGIEPGTTRVYADRAALGWWEDVALTSHPEGWYDVRFIAANRQLTVTPTGSLESRIAGAIGEWERFLLSADHTTLYRMGVTLTIAGAAPVVAIHLEQRGNNFVDAQGQRVVYPCIDQFFAFRQYRDGGPAALTPALEESRRLGFTAWRMWAQGSKAQNTIADLSPTEAGYYDDIRPCTDLLNAHGIVPLWTAYIDNQDVQSPMAHWNRLGERLIGSAALMSLANQYEKNIGALDINAFGSPGDGLLWSRGSSVTLDKQTPPRGAPLSELHPVDISFERALMDSTASPFNMRSTNGSTLVMMTECHPFGDSAAWSEQQAWMLGRGYSIDWGLACFHNRQSQRMLLLHDDTARAAAAWVKGMRL